MIEEEKTDRILIVEDDPTLQMVFKRALESRGYSSDLATDGKAAIQRAATGRYFMIFMDILIPEISGLDVLDRLKKADPDGLVVMMTAENTMRNAIEAMRRGAYDYLSKPIDLEDIFLLLDKAGKEREFRSRMRSYEKELKRRFDIGEIIGSSRKMQEIFKVIGKTASSDLTVLIRGESGTGKELVARALHYHSPRVVYPFVAVNCAAIPRELVESELFGHEKGSFTGAADQKKGKFEIAEQGTLFLDEIGDMGGELQAKILRVLQEREFYRVGGREILKVGARIIAATNQDLEAAVRKKSFREDLYHRLHVVSIALPPLRERREDIPLLVEYFLEKFNSRGGVKRFSPDAMAALQGADWPGNVRQLENIIKQCVVLSSHETIFPEHLPDYFWKSTGGKAEGTIPEAEARASDPMDALIGDGMGSLYQSVIHRTERDLITRILVKYGWNQVKASHCLGINRNTLKRKMDELGIKRV